MPLQVEISAAEFSQQERNYLNSMQDIQSYEIRPPFPQHPLVGALAEGLHWFEGYEPNHVSVHRYRSSELGITPHYDEKKYGILIAALTIKGSADFSIVEDPDPDRALPSCEVISARQAAPVLRTWETTPGDLILMRAPGFAGSADGRPLHQISGGKEGHRTALVFRMDTQAR